MWKHRLGQKRVPSRGKKHIDLRRRLLAQAKATGSREALDEALKFSLEGLNRVGQELKCKDDHYREYGGDHGRFWCVNKIAKGAAIDQRIGLECVVKEVEISFAIQHDLRCQIELEDEIPSIWRVLVVHDMFCNGEGLDQIGLFDTDHDPDTGVYYGPNIGWPSCTLTPYNLRTRQRMVILYDKLYTLGMTQQSRGLQSTPIVDRVLVKCDVPMMFNPYTGQEGTVGDIMTGAIWFCVFTDYAVWPYAAPSMPIIRATSRVRFTDS